MCELQEVFCCSGLFTWLIINVLFCSHKRKNKHGSLGCLDWWHATDRNIKVSERQENPGKHWWRCLFQLYRTGKAPVSGVDWWGDDVESKEKKLERLILSVNVIKNCTDVTLMLNLWHLHPRLPLIHRNQKALLLSTLDIGGTHQSAHEGEDRQEQARVFPFFLFFFFKFILWFSDVFPDNPLNSAQPLSFTSRWREEEAWVKSSYQLWKICLTKAVGKWTHRSPGRGGGGFGGRCWWIFVLIPPQRGKPRWMQLMKKHDEYSYVAPSFNTHPHDYHFGKVCLLYIIHQRKHIQLSPAGPTLHTPWETWPLSKSQSWLSTSE